MSTSSRRRNIQTKETSEDSAALPKQDENSSVTRRRHVQEPPSTEKSDNQNKSVRFSNSTIVREFSDGKAKHRDGRIKTTRSSTESEIISETVILDSPRKDSP